MTTKVEAPWPGPYYGPSDPQRRGPDKGPYIIALKRSLVRWTGGTGALKWQKGGNFNATYNPALEADVERFKKHKGITTPKWVWGGNAHEALKDAVRGGGAAKPKQPLEPAIDQVAVELMKDGYDLRHPGVRDAKKFTAVMSSYLEEMEDDKAIWHYLQRRPIGTLGVPPDSGGRDDCSALCITAYYWTRTHTGLVVPDPAGYGYTGYGNTVSIYMLNRMRKLSLSQPFQVGDIGLYGPFASRHAVICRVGGSTATSVWTSHGSEAGPYACRLLYREDLFAVVRPSHFPVPPAA